MTDDTGFSPGDHAARAAKARDIVEGLLAGVEALDRLYPGRKFTLDGHLVGSIGEVLAEEMFDLSLVRPSTSGHDAVTPTGIDTGTKVEIKATYGSRGVAVRLTSTHHDGAKLIVVQLRRPSEGAPTVVYNGPLESAFDLAGTVGSSGQAHISLSRLRELNKSVPDDARVPRR